MFMSRHRFSFIVLCAPVLALAARASTAPLALTYPHGGEFFAIGASQKVTLDAKTKLSPITVELSRDGGNNFVPLGTIAVTRGTVPSLSFTVTGPASGNCVVRVSAPLKGSSVVTL